MARIEIPMEEYNGMREQIDSLEKTIVEKNKEIQVLKNKNLNLQTTLEEVSEISLYERIFKWGSMFKLIVGNEETK